MPKKNSKNSNIIIAVLIVLTSIFFIKFNNPSTLISQQSQFAEKEKMDTNLGSNLNTGTVESSNPTSISNPRTDLCSVITPYVLIFDLQGLCNENGGIWTCNHDDIGCYNLNADTIDCSISVVQTALTQCRNSGGSAGCDSQNVYCKY